MPKTHLRFKNFRPQAVEAAQRLFEAKPWNLEFGSDEQIEVAKRFVAEISAVYNVPTAEVETSRWQHSAASYQTAQVMVNSLEQIQSIAPPKIILARWSITSLLIATRTHLLANGIEQHADDPEAWAHSLFYTVKPAMFRARVREGRIGGLTAKDTFSTETWLKLVAAGIGQEWNDSIVCRPNEVAGILQQIDAGTFAGYGGAAIEDPDFVSENDDDNLEDELEFDSDADDEAAAVEGAVSEFLADHDLDSATIGETTVEAVSERPVVPAEAPVIAEGDQDAVAALRALGIVKLRKASRGRLQGGYTLPLDRLAAELHRLGVTPADVEEAVSR